MTHMTLSDLPNTDTQLERLRKHHTSNTIDVVLSFEEVLSEYFRDALRHTATVRHSPTVTIHGPRTLTVTHIN